MEHILWETGDTGAPQSILDRNGEVVLGLCKVCGKGECDLDSPCIDTRQYGDTVNTEKVNNLVDKNLKTAAAVNKPKVSPIPPIAIMALGSAMQDGCDKYGRFNWRDTAVTASVFYDAMMRHIIAWYSGEDYAPDSGVHHLAHLMAGAAIILDGQLNGVFNDDRAGVSRSGSVVTPNEMYIYKQSINKE